MIEALIFDFDGTIIDTEYPDYASWNDVYQQHGEELPFEVWSQYIGTTLGSFDPFAYLEERLVHKLDRELVRSERRRRYEEMVLAQPILPGVTRLWRDAKARGWKLGIASSSTRSWVCGHLTRLGWMDHFDVIRTSDDVDRVKPDPALYLQSLTALGLAASQAVAIEDSANGALAAKAAGLACIVVPNTLTRNLTFPPVDRIVNSLEEVHLDDLLP